MYDVLYKTDLTDTNDWLELTSDWDGTGMEMAFEDDTSVTSRRFYRVTVKEP
jgi:hypothetical protein